MEPDDNSFESIVKGIEFDSSITKLTKAPKSGQKLVGGSILVIMGISSILASISLLGGFWELLGGVLGFAVAWYGALILMNGWSSRKNNLDMPQGTQKGLLNESSPFMKKMNARWDKYKDEQRKLGN